MGDAQVVRNEIADPQIAQQCLHFEIEVEVPVGWTERVAVPSPARPGEVRGAVEKLLRDLGLTSV